MRYATLMVHLRSGQPNTSLLKVAGHFAERFDSHVIGIAACQSIVGVSVDGTTSGDELAIDQRRISADLDMAQAEFRAALQGHVDTLEWRSKITIELPVHYLSHQARGADLVMTGSMPADPFDPSNGASAGSLVMAAGRPVFIVPLDAATIDLRSVLVAWKDTVECRRAAADALPLLKQTDRILVCEIAAFDDLDAAQARIDDVVIWLERHGVHATGRVECANGNAVDQLHAAAKRCDADVIVAGAYGHGRLREWVIGGVTRDLLLECRCGVLVSH